MLKIMLGTLLVLVLSSSLFAQNYGCDKKVHLSSGYCYDDSCRGEVNNTPPTETGDCGYKQEYYDEADIKEYGINPQGNGCRYQVENERYEVTNSAPKGSKAKHEQGEGVIHECGSRKDRCNPKAPCFHDHGNGYYEVITPENKPIDEAYLKEQMNRGRGPGK